MCAKVKGAAARTAATAGASPPGPAIPPSLGFLPAYRAAAWLTHRLAPALRLPFAAALPARRAALDRWRVRAVAATRGAVWIHAASVGEALAAVPIVRRLRAVRSDLRVVLTHTSPAPAAWPSPWGVDHADFLPLDTPRAMETLLSALAPRLLVLTRAEVWPELVSAALRHAVPVALVGAVVGARSNRLRWPVRPALRPLYARLAYAGAVSEQDRQRLRRLGVPDAALEVTGDPRHDQVLERIPDLRPLGPLARWAAGRDVLVAGSTEERDEAVLLRALATLRPAQPNARLLLCPHTPGAGRTAHLLALARRAGVSAAPWPRYRAGTAEDAIAADVACVVVERLGLLADAYLLGRAAYVGGGFGRRGIHAVIEPAACALPVIVGPRGVRGDARALLEAGGAVGLPPRGAARTLGEIWRAWTVDDPGRVRTGLAARGALAGGAAGRTAERLLALLR